jgi:hypothetical protein
MPLAAERSVSIGEAARDIADRARACDRGHGRERHALAALQAVSSKPTAPVTAVVLLATLKAL